jgi:hypothetical protein
VDDVLGAPAALGAGAERLRLWRRVSWTPGAEGAPRTAGVLWVDVVVGIMRRDCVVRMLVGSKVEVRQDMGGVYHCERLVVPGGRPVVVL